MARGGTSIEGLDVLNKRLRALPAVVEAGCRRAVRDETVEAAQDMRRNAPVDTRELKDGVQAELVDLPRLEGRAVSSADHTPYVVYGTSDTAANDFITPAADRSRRRFPGRVREDVLAELRKITE